MHLRSVAHFLVDAYWILMHFESHIYQQSCINGQESFAWYEPPTHALKFFNSWCVVNTTCTPIVKNSLIEEWCYHISCNSVLTQNSQWAPHLLMHIGYIFLRSSTRLWLFEMMWGSLTESDDGGGWLLVFLVGNWWHSIQLVPNLIQ